MRAAVALLAVAALVGVAPSGADFTDSASSPGNTFAAAADFNSVAVTLTDPGSVVQGTVTLQASASSDRGITSVRLQRSPAGAGAWTDVCERTAPPYSCSWATGGLADGAYDLRAVAVDAVGYTRTSVVAGRAVDNVAPTVSLGDPGASIGGTKTLTATAADAGSGVDRVTIQQRAQGATGWTDICTDTAAPWSCDLVTTALPDGNRELRAVAVDRAGRSTASSVRTARIDNTPPQQTATFPPEARGTVTVSATAQDDESGIESVAWEVLFGGSWLQMCVDTTAPYTCSADTRQAPDGVYSARTVTTNGAGVRTVGSTFQITVDNTAPAAADVQGGNGTGTAGRLDAGDRLTLTWTEPIAPASVASGWDGTSRAVRVKVSATDELDVYDSAGTTRLNLVATAVDLKLGADYVTTAAEFQATMTRSGSTITITFGSLVSGTVATAGAGTLTWRPSASATDIVGNPSRTDLRTEAGGSDVDF